MHQSDVSYCNLMRVCERFTPNSILLELAEVTVSRSFLCTDNFSLLQEVKLMKTLPHIRLDFPHKGCGKGGILGAMRSSSARRLPQDKYSNNSKNNTSKKNL